MASGMGTGSFGRQTYGAQTLQGQLMAGQVMPGTQHIGGSGYPIFGQGQMIGAQPIGAQMYGPQAVGGQMVGAQMAGSQMYSGQVVGSQVMPVQMTQGQVSSYLQGGGSMYYSPGLVAQPGHSISPILPGMSDPGRGHGATLSHHLSPQVQQQLLQQRLSGTSPSQAHGHAMSQASTSSPIQAHSVLLPSSLHSVPGESSPGLSMGAQIAALPSPAALASAGHGAYLQQHGLGAVHDLNLPALGSTISEDSQRLRLMLLRAAANSTPEEGRTGPNASPGPPASKGPGTLGGVSGNHVLQGIGYTAAEAAQLAQGLIQRLREASTKQGSPSPAPPPPAARAQEPFAPSSTSSASPSSAVAAAVAASAAAASAVAAAAAAAPPELPASSSSAPPAGVPGTSASQSMLGVPTTGQLAAMAAATAATRGAGSSVPSAPAGTAGLSSTTAAAAVATGAPESQAEDARKVVPRNQDALPAQALAPAPMEKEREVKIMGVDLAARPTQAKSVPWTEAGAEQKATEGKGGAGPDHPSEAPRGEARGGALAAPEDAVEHGIAARGKGLARGSADIDMERTLGEAEDDDAQNEHAPGALKDDRGPKARAAPGAREIDLEVPDVGVEGREAEGRAAKGPYNEWQEKARPEMHSEREDERDGSAAREPQKRWGESSGQGNLLETEAARGSSRRTPFLDLEAPPEGMAEDAAQELETEAAPEPMAIASAGAGASASASEQSVTEPVARLSLPFRLKLQLPPGGQQPSLPSTSPLPTPGASTPASAPGTGEAGAVGGTSVAPGSGRGTAGVASGIGKPADAAGTPGSPLPQDTQAPMSVLLPPEGSANVCKVEGCGKTFPDASALRKHMHTHGNRQHVCQFEGCGRVREAPWPCLFVCVRLQELLADRVAPRTTHQLSFYNLHCLSQARLSCVLAGSIRERSPWIGQVWCPATMHCNLPSFPFLWSLHERRNLWTAPSSSATT